MTLNTIRGAAAALTLIAFAACGGDDSAEREIELAPAGADAALADTAETPAATPAAAPAPAAPTKAPATTASRPASSTSAVRSGVLGAGTVIEVASGARVCTNTHKVGDRFTATTTSTEGGTTGGSLPAGTEVTLEVVESARGENGQDKVKLAFKPVSVSVRGRAVTLAADVTQVAALQYERVQSTGTQAGKVAAGAAAGAVAGQLLGKNTKSTVAGAAIGAAAGGAVAAATTDYHGCLPAQGAVSITLKEPLRIS